MLAPKSPSTASFFMSHDVSSLPNLPRRHSMATPPSSNPTAPAAETFLIFHSKSDSLFLSHHRDGWDCQKSFHRHKADCRALPNKPQPDRTDEHILRTLNANYMSAVSGGGRQRKLCWVLRAVHLQTAFCSLPRPPGRAIQIRAPPNKFIKFIRVHRSARW